MTHELGHILLIDVSGFIHRAYHVGSGQYRSSDGLPTWAITGTMAILWRLLGAAQGDAPTHAAAVFDAPGGNWRHAIFPEYKNNRPARNEELLAQLPYIHHAVEAMGVAAVELSGYEADDVLAALATKFMNLGIRSSVVSSDKDLLQIVVDGWIEVIDPVQDIRLREADVRGWKFGVAPKQVPDFQALAGDAVDNIPGIRGIGPKSAAMMIREFGDIEGVVAAAQARHHYFTGGQRNALKGALEELRLYRRLATLDREAPLDVALEDLELRPVMRDHVESILDKLEARGRFDRIFRTSPKMMRPVEAVSHDQAFEWWAEECVVSGQPVPEVPQCGYYMGRLGKGRPLAPARIWRQPEVEYLSEIPTGREVLQCEIAGIARDPLFEWPNLARKPISNQEFDFQMREAAWARQYSPDEPIARPSEVIDILKSPFPVFPPTPAKRKRL